MTLNKSVFFFGFVSLRNSVGKVKSTERSIVQACDHNYSFCLAYILANSFLSSTSFR